MYLLGISRIGWSASASNGKWMDMPQNIIKDNSPEIELYYLETDPRELVSFAF